MKETVLKFGHVEPKYKITTSKPMFKAQPKATVLKASGTPKYLAPGKINRPTYTP